MNDFSELEAELKKMRPAAISTELTSRVGFVLARHSERSEAQRNEVEAVTQPTKSARPGFPSRGGGFTVLQRDPSTSLGMTDEMPRRPRHSNWLPLGLGVAAAAAFVLLARVNVPRPATPQRNVASITPMPSTPMTPANSNFVPAGLTQVVYNTRDEGLLFRQGADQPVRRLRSRTRETLQWRNPETGASLRVSYPSEEVTLVPVPGQ